MKKRLKGLIALILAMTMVVSTATSAFATISDEDYDKINSRNIYMRMLSMRTDQLEKELETNGMIDAEEYYGNSLSLGDKPVEAFDYYYKFYNVNSLHIYEVKEDGNIHSDSKKKEVDLNYVVSEEDIKEYGNVSGSKNYFPCVVANLEPKNYKLDIYDETGTTKVSEITYNIESDKGTEELEIPEGYVGYILHSEHEYIETEYIYDEETWEVIDTIEHNIIEKAEVFISSYADLVKEMNIADYYKYEFIKLVPTKKMPYRVTYVENENTYWGPGNDSTRPVIWLEPDEKIVDNQDIRKELAYRDVDDDSKWTVWTVNYCGGSDQLYKDEITTALTPEDYSITRPSDALSTYYYKENYPILMVYAPVKIYNIPYYDMDGVRCEDFNVNVNMLDWGYECECEEIHGCCLINDRSDNCTCEFLKRQFECSYPEGMCPDAWEFEYDGHNYGEVNNLSIIWEVVTDEDYDSSKAKLTAICNNHIYDYKNGKIVSQPTINKKGSTKYTCTKCGDTTIVDDIDKLIPLESVVLSNSEYTYSGLEFRPSVTVKAYVNSRLTTLTKDDYTVSYKDNKDVGTATVTVTGKGIYSGTKTATFEINPIEITAFDLNVKTEYTGKDIKGTVVVYAGDTKLTEEKDYTVSYKDNKSVGVATVTVKGKGIYTGTLTKTFTIKPRRVSGLKQSTYKTESISLKWNKVEGVTKYEIFKKNAKTGKFESIGTTRTNTFTVKNLKAGSKYKFAVRAYTEINRVKIYGDTSEIKTMITKTVAPRINVTSKTKRRAIITWKKVAGADGYEVYMSASRGGKYKKIALLSKGSLKYTKRNLNSKSSYYFKVRSYIKNADGKKVYSSYSKVDSVKIK